MTMLDTIQCKWCQRVIPRNHDRSCTKCYELLRVIGANPDVTAKMVRESSSRAFPDEQAQYRQIDEHVRYLQIDIEGAKHSMALCMLG